MEEVSIRRAALNFAVSGTVLVVTFALSALGQDTKPNFTGVWRCSRITRGPCSDSTTEVRQTAYTFAIRHALPNKRPMDWSIYPTDGKTTTTSGRNPVERTGHWEAERLILEETGRGNAPWRRSTERQIISLSEDGRTMRIGFHYLSDKTASRDYAVEFERIEP